MSDQRDEQDTSTVSDSERQHIDDVRRAAEYARNNPHMVVTPEVLKKARIRAWRHQYRPEYVAHLIKLVYGTE